jgi:hypothetical protein
MNTKRHRPHDAAVWDPLNTPGQPEKHSVPNKPNETSQTKRVKHKPIQAKSSQIDNSGKLYKPSLVL